MEGFGRHGSHIDAKLFSIAFQVSSMIIYNSVGSITEQAIAYMSFITSLSGIISVSEDELQSDYSLSYYSPRFMWLLRDYTIPTDQDDGVQMTSDQYLETILTELSGQVSETSLKSRQTFINLFKDKECIDFCHPGNGNENGLNYHFHKQVFKLRERIYSRSQAKQIDGVTFSARMMASYLQSIVNSLNNGMRFVILDAWGDVEENECVSSYNDATELYRENLKKNFEMHDTPFSSTELYRIMKDMRDQSMDILGSAGLIKDNSPDLYDEYTQKLQAFIDNKESLIFKLNEGLAETQNTEVQNGLTEKVTIFCDKTFSDKSWNRTWAIWTKKLGQYVQRTRKVIFLLVNKRVYDVYTERAMGANKTRHFIDLIKSMNHNLIASYVEVAKYYFLS